MRVRPGASRHRSGTVEFLYRDTVRSNWRSIWLPRLTASSSACLADLLARQRRLDLLGPHVAQLHHVAEPQPARVLGRLLVGELEQRRLEVRELLVVARRLGLLVGRLGDRQVARLLVQLHLAVGVGQEGEELGDALVFLRALAAHHPQRGAADDGVLRRAGDVGVVGHRRGAEVELGVGPDVAEEGRRGQEDRAFARGEAALAGVGAARVVVGLVLLQLDQRLQVLHLQRRVELQLGVEAVHAVGLGGERHVVPGRELLEVDPGDPGVAEAAVGIAGGLQLLGGLEHFGPGLRRLVGVEAGLLERVLVVPHHRAGRVERERQHLALGGGIVAGDGRQVGLGIERLAGLLHQHVHRLHGAGRRHHGGGADLEHLHDVRRLAGAEGGDAGIHGVGIAALVGRDDLVVLLGALKSLASLTMTIVVGAGHRVPPLDLGLRRGIAGRKQHRAGSEPAQADRISHKSSSSLGASASSDGRFLQLSHDNGVSVGQRHGRQGSPTGRVHGRAHIPGRRSLAAGTAGRICRAKTEASRGSDPSRKRPTSDAAAAARGLTRCGGRHGQAGHGSGDRSGHHVEPRHRVRRRLGHPGPRAARVCPALPSLGLGGARSRGHLAHDGGDRPAGAGRRQAGRQRHRRHRHHQPARDLRRLGPAHRQADPSRHRVAGPAHGGGVPHPQACRPRADRHRQDRPAARPLLLRHQDRLAARPRGRRARARQGGPSGLRHHRQLPDLAPHRRQGARHRRHQRLAHAALRHRQGRLRRRSARAVRRAALDAAARCATATPSYGATEPSILGGAIPILGVAGDQQAATIGQACFSARHGQGHLRHRLFRAAQHRRSSPSPRATGC